MTDRGCATCQYEDQKGYISPCDVCDDELTYNKWEPRPMTRQEFADRSDQLIDAYTGNPGRAGAKQEYEEGMEKLRKEWERV